MSLTSRMRRRVSRPLWIEPLEDRTTPSLAYGISGAGTGGTDLIRFDTASPGVIITTPIKGLAAGENIRGIDFQPRTGLLYALGITDTPGADSGQLYTLNATSGVLTKVGAGPFSLFLADNSQYGFAFHPANGGIRVVNNNMDNLFLDATNGTQIINPADPALPLNPFGRQVVGISYDNNTVDAAMTTLFGVDFGGVLDQLVRIGDVNGAPPATVNMGTVVTIGNFDLVGVAHVTVNPSIGFDILTDGGTNTAFMSARDTVSGKVSLYRVNLAGGNALVPNQIGDGLKEISSLAVLPNTFTGTGGNDVFTISANPTVPDTVLVSLGGVNQGAFSNTAEAPLTITALDGDDVITIGDGVVFAAGTSLDGGAGSDTIDFSNAKESVAISLGTEHLFTSALDAAQVVPASGSAATGTAFVVFGNATKNFDIRIDVTDIKLADLTKSSLNDGAAGANGESIFDLGDGSLWVQTGTNTISRTVNGATLPAANVANLLAGKTYITISTTGSPDGEIRGQVKLAAAPGFAGATGKLTAFENASGGRGNDVILGDATPNILRGGAGNDILLGRAGADTLRGDFGNDLLIGGTGADNVFGGLTTGSMVTLNAAGDALIKFNATTPETVTTVPLFGLPGGTLLLGIDFRPSTGQLFGFGMGFYGQAQIYTIDIDTGATSLVGGGQLIPGGVVWASFGIDFDPLLDQIRIVNDVALQNFRLNPDTGLLIDGDPVAAGIQGDRALVGGKLVGIASDNNTPDAATTTLFGIDATTNKLVTLATPINGMITPVGALGVDVDTKVGFDIGTDGQAFATFSVAGVDALYSVDLTSGAATKVGNIGTAGVTMVNGLAIVPGTITDDDRLVWNNGDGTDKMDGADGSDTVEVNGSNTEGDTFEISANTTKSTVTFARTNLGAFTLTITTSEALQVNGQGGDDKINVQSTLNKFTVALSGGAGNDAFSLDSNTTATAGGTSKNVISGVTIDGGAGTDTFTLEDSDTTTAITLTIAGGKITGSGKGADVTFTTIEAVTTNLGKAADTVTLTPVAGLTFNINGNTPTDANADKLILTLTGITGTTGTSTGTGSGKFTFTNAGDVNFTGIESTTPPITTTPTPGTPGSFKLSTNFTVGSGPGGGTINVIDGKTGTVIRSLTPFGAGFTGGVRTSTGDVNNDGTPDTLAGTGPGVVTEIVIFDGKTGNELFRMKDLFGGFTAGLYVAVGDVNGDGFGDIVVAPDIAGGPRIRVFSGRDMTQIDDFFGIEGDPNFRGGARVSVADIDNDGFGDIIVAAGFGGGPRIAIYSGKTLGQHAAGGSPPKVTPDFSVFEDTLRNGVFVGGGDVNGDGFGDIVVGGGPGGGPRVFVLSGKDRIAGTTTQLGNFFAGDPNGRSGGTVTVKDLDGDNKADITAAAGGTTTVIDYFGKDIATDGVPPNSQTLTGLTGLTNGVNVG